MKLLKSDRVGLVIVVASLFAIAAAGYVIFHYQYQDRVAGIRAQGLSLVRVLSGVPFDHLAPGGSQQGVMQVLQHGERNNRFAYVSIVDPSGNFVNEVVADGVLVPGMVIPEDPTAWLGEITHNGRPARPSFLEFHGPLLDEGELRGFVRLGYFYPAFGPGIGELSFLATVSLPVFLLAPLFYFLMQREIRPVRKANEAIGDMLEGQSFSKIEISTSGELQDFMQRFNRFVELADARIQDLEADHKRALTSAKLLTYRKNRVETVLETLPEAVLILDETGCVTFANQKLASLFGVSQQVILDQPPQTWCDNPDVLQMLAKHKSGARGRSFSETIRFSVNSAASQSIVTKSFPLFSPKKPTSAIGTLVIFRDETQEALARMAREEFVANLSHELKSPLNVLAMYSETLQSNSGRDEAFRVEAANVIAEEVDRLKTLITGLLNMTQIEAGSLTPEKSLVKLQDVAGSVFEEAKRSAGDRDLTFLLDVPKEMSPALIDKDLIRIALTNLLSNAVKYNRNGGEVHLKVEETADAIQIRVADSGIGIAHEDAAKVFDKFYRAGDERVQAIGGHGLGLALTKQIVELHQGSLTINTDRDEGVEFIINLWKDTTSVRQAI